MKIAILGATGHIAKGLIEHLSRSGHSLILYSRQSENHWTFFPRHTYDVVINGIGVGHELWRIPHKVFSVTEFFDNIVIDWLRSNPGALYINLSSGAIYGDRFTRPASEESKAVFDVNHVSPSSFYGIAKLHAEAKHRALQDLNIVDLRVFSYFSRYLSPESRCLMNDVLSAVRSGNELLTGEKDFLRDYVHPNDLGTLVERVIAMFHLNAAFDVYSIRPAGKFEILDHFRDEYGLRYRVVPDLPETSPTGEKVNYYSNNTAAAEIGYLPEYTAMDAIREEAAKLLAAEKVTA